MRALRQLWACGSLLLPVFAFCYPPMLQGDIPGSGDVCIYENLTAGQYEQFPVVVHQERGKSEYGFRICLRQASDWPEGANSVRLAVKDSTTGLQSEYAEAVLVRPTGAITNARLSRDADNQGGDNMAITLVQARPLTQGSGVTSMSDSFASNVTNGNLIFVAAYAYMSTAAPVFVSGSLTKTAGTATIGTPALAINATNTTGSPQHAAVWTVPVTGTGSLTLQVGGMTSGSYAGMVIGEVSGADTSGTRVEATNSATFDTPTTAVDTGNATSAGGALFVGALAFDTGSFISITEDAAWTLLGEHEDGGTNETGSLIYRIVTSGTTDSASWTLGIGPNSSAAVVAVIKAGTAAATSQVAKRAFPRPILLN